MHPERGEAKTIPRFLAGGGRAAIMRPRGPGRTNPVRPGGTPVGYSGIRRPAGFIFGRRTPVGGISRRPRLTPNRRPDPARCSILAAEPVPLTAAVVVPARGRGNPVPSASMEKLLATVIQLKASDLHISTGQPPVIRHHGRLRKLEAKVLDSEDTTGLMKSITPDRCQQELQQRGGTDFAIEYTDGVRFRCAV